MAELRQEVKFENSMPIAVNTTPSFLVPAGNHSDSDYSSVGVEEFTKFRIINSTFYGLEVGDTPNTGDTFYHVSVIDLNRTGVTVQRGQGTIDSGETVDTITPSAYNKTNSMLFVSYNTNGDFGQDPDDVAMKATINGADDLIFVRDDASSNTIDYSWELIEYEDGFSIAQHFNGTQADGTTDSFETIPIPVGNFSRSWAIGTVSSPFGLGNGLSDSVDVGSFDRSTGTITLENATHVELVRGTGTDSYEVGLQVVEFLEQVQVAQNFTENILDVVTAVDLSQNKNVTKLTSDTVASSDTVNTNAIFVIELSDTGTTTDILSLNITKLNLDLVTALDNLDHETIIGLSDTASVVDAVGTDVVTLLLLTDLATTTDEIQLAITKIFADNVVTSDEINFVISKLLDDTAVISDQADVVATLRVDELDLVTANDLVILDVTKQFTDVTAVIDDLNLNPTKVFIDKHLL